MKWFDLILSIISVSVLFILSINYLKGKEGSSSKIFKLLCIVFSVRIIIALAYFGFNLPPNLPDTRTFEESVKLFMSSGFNFSAIANRFDVRNYVVLNSGLRILFGNTWIVTVVINSLIGSFAIYYASNIAGEIAGDKAKILTILFLTIEPTNLLYTNTHLREAIVLFFIIVSFYNLTKYIIEEEKKYIFFFFGWALVSGLFRAVNIFVLFIGGAACVIMSFKKKNLNNKKTLIIILSLIGAVFLGVILLNVVLGFKVDIDYVNQNLNRDTIGGGTMPYLVGERYESWFDLIRCIPKRLFYLVLYPFPWLLSSYSTIVPAFSSLYNAIFIILIIGLLIKNYKCVNLNNEKYKVIIKLLVVSLICLIIYAVAKTEVAHRHRMQFTWILPVLASSILTENVKKYRRNKYI